MRRHKERGRAPTAITGSQLSSAASYCAEEAEDIMGQASSKNKTGKKVVKQKLEHAEKTGILSLTEHGLKEVPPAVLALSSLRTLDLSANALKAVPEELCGFVQLKTLKVPSRARASIVDGGVSRRLPPRVALCVCR